jgi:hypothetical protein
MSCAELGAERETTVDQALIRGLVTAFRSSSRGFPRSRGRASGAKSGHKSSDGSSPPFALRSRVCAAGERGRSLRGRDLPSDRPQESGHLAGNRSHDDGRLLAHGAEAAIASAQTDLRLPGDVAHRLRQPFEPRPQGLADPCGITIGPRPLDQRPTSAPVARQGEALPSDCVAG